MKTTRITIMVLAALILAASSATLLASGPAGVYCIIDKVVFEPNDKAPERVQIWGAFAVATGRDNDYMSTPQAGYMYFKLPSTANQSDIAKKEWADMKVVAGTGQGISFGLSWNPKNGRVRRSTDRVNSPDVYPIGSGLSKVDGTRSTPLLYVESSRGAPTGVTIGGLIDQIREVLKKSKATAVKPKP